MTQNHENRKQNQNTSAFGSPLKKRVAVGAVTAMAAGSLLGLGAVGANAAPLDSSTEAGSTATTSPKTDPVTVPAGELTEAEQTEATAALTALTEQLQGQLADSSDAAGAGSTDADAAQIVTDAIAEHPDLFQSLPVNLQTDLTALGEANSDQDIAADTIETTALSGGYGEQIQTLAEAIQQDPEHPLAAVLQALAASDAVVGDVAADGLAEGAVTEGAPTEGAPTEGAVTEGAPTEGAVTEGAVTEGAPTEGEHDRGLSPEKIAAALLENTVLFDKLPPELQADLTELQATPEADRAAGADAIKSTALEGGYGEQIQAIAERVVQNFADAGTEPDAGTEAEAEADADAEAEAEAGTEAGTEAEAGAEAEVDETVTDSSVEADAEVKAGVHDAN